MDALHYLLILACIILYYRFKPAPPSALVTPSPPAKETAAKKTTKKTKKKKSGKQASTDVSSVDQPSKVDAQPLKADDQPKMEDDQARAVTDQPRNATDQPKPKEQKTWNAIPKAAKNAKGKHQQEWPAPQPDPTPVPTPPTSTGNTSKYKENNDMLSEDEDNAPRVMRIGAPSKQPRAPGKLRAVVGAGGWSTIAATPAAAKTAPPPSNDPEALTKKQRENLRKVELRKEAKAIADAEQAVRLERYRLSQMKQMYG